MPIFGRSGESLGTRVFGKSGMGETSRTLTNLAVSPFSTGMKVGNRVMKGLATPGGFLGKAKEIALGPNAQASGGEMSGFGMSSSIGSQYNQPVGPSYNGPQTQPQTKANSPASSAYANQGRVTSNLDKLRNMELSQINDAYTGEKKRLNKLIDTTNSMYGTARQNMLNYQPQLEQEKATRYEQLQNEENQRIQESRSALQQVRQLLADQQRRGQAYLAATGNVNSSIVGPQSEMFQRAANQGLGKVQTDRQNALNLVMENRQKVDDYYSRKQLELQDNLANLEQQHLAQLDQIAQAKNQSRQAKSQATLEAWRGYVQNRTALENALMNVGAQWKSTAQQYGLDMGNDFETLSQSLDSSENIFAPEALNGVSDAEDYTGDPNGALRSPVIFNQNPDQLDLYQLQSLINNGGLSVAQ